MTAPAHCLVCLLTTVNLPTAWTPWPPLTETGFAPTGRVVGRSMLDSQRGYFIHVQR